MKMRPLAILFTLFFCAFSSLTFAQEYRAYSGTKFQKSIYAELGGSHLVGGINFDMRLQRGQRDGIGFRAGIGGLSAEGYRGSDRYTAGIVTFPLEINHLVAGKKRGAFVSGAGILPVYATVSGRGELTDYEYIRAEGFDVVGGFLTLGYRHQAYRNGLMFQIQWNPMVLRGSGFNGGWMSIGLGFTFK